jgi:DNA-binding transcriptional MerR regulator
LTLPLRGGCTLNYMFKIREFSQLGKVSVKTLRFYDQLGLLKPAHVQPESGYRYYTAQQLLRLNRILVFKELGFTLEQIVKLLDDDISPEQIRGMFRLKQAEVQTLIETERHRLSRIEGHLQQIEREQGTLGRHGVLLKSLEPQQVISIREKTAPAYVPALLQELYDYLEHHGVAINTPASYTVLWHGCEECDDATDLEVAFPIAEILPGNQRIQQHILPAVPTTATILHQCQPRGVCNASPELARWVEHNNYRLVENSPCREVYLTPTENAHYIAEVQLPVTAQ